MYSTTIVQTGNTRVRITQTLSTQVSRPAPVNIIHVRQGSVNLPKVSSQQVVNVYGDAEIGTNNGVVNVHGRKK